MNEITPGVGHNSGEPPQAENPLDVKKARVDVLVANADRWRTERPEITDAEMAGKCSDFIEQMTKEARTLDKERLEATAPFRLQVDVINIAFNSLTKRLDVAKDLLKKLLTPWQLKEKERLKAEAAQKEAEALALVAQADEAQKAVEAGTATVDQTVAAGDLRKAATTAVRVADRAINAKVATQGEFGSRARGLRTVWSATVTDYAKAVAHYQDHPKVRDLIQQLADADARSPERRGVAVPGVEFKERQEAA